MKRAPALLLPLLALALCGCQNNYSKFYTSTLKPGYEIWLQPFSGHTDFVSTSIDRFVADRDTLMRRGYRVIGVANFQAGARDYSSSLKEQAKLVGADVVLMASSYARTISGVVPFTTFSPGKVSTTYSSGTVNASAYGSGGTANAIGNYSGTSTTIGPATSDTTFIPYQVERDNYAACFFRKGKFVFGANTNPLTDAQRAQYQRNAGLCVMMVADGSPAFNANVLVGDVLISIDGESITTNDAFMAQVAARAGKTARFTILRGDKTLNFDVALNLL